MELPKITPIVQFVTASFALVVGGYTVGDKFGWLQKDILEWPPSTSVSLTRQSGALSL